MLKSWFSFRVAQQYLLFLVCSIIVVVPFHAFLTTWASTIFGHLLLLRAWKEFLMVVCALLGVILLIKNAQLRSVFFRDHVVRFSALFAAWLFVVAIFLTYDVDAMILGLAIHLRGPLFFLLAAAAVFSRPVTERFLQKLVIYPAIGVIAFGVLQLFVLPHDILRHFGYQKHVTIPPFFTIDEQQDKIRIISTLRGPNPLGAYLIAPLLAVVSILKIKMSSSKNLLAICCLLLASLLVLYGSHSRSAWLGLAVAAAVYVWCIASHRLRMIMAALVLIGSLVLTGAIYTYRHHSFVQDVVLHDNPDEGGEISSNGSRIIALQESFADIKRAPIFGCGAGCAGPASAHHANGAKISENFFIQIVQEAGFIGLGLFMMVFVQVLRRLHGVGTYFAYAWLGVAIGVSVASLLSHAWADDTITYLWWGITGLLVGIPRRQTPIRQKIP